MIYALETELAPWALNALIVIWGVIMIIAMIILLITVIDTWRNL